MILVNHHRLHLHPRFSIATSSDVDLSMRFGLTRHLPLNRSSVFVSGSRKETVAMAMESKNLVETSMKETNKKGEEEVTVPPPPPPEKPEPGDCCGNGCVRCVWDVYYEELEDYNKLNEETKSNGQLTRRRSIMDCRVFGATQLVELPNRTGYPTRATISEPYVQLFVSASFCD